MTCDIGGMLSVATAHVDTTPQIDWATVGAVDDTGELLGIGPYKPKKVRARYLGCLRFLKLGNSSAAFRYRVGPFSALQIMPDLLTARVHMTRLKTRSGHLI